ncbi:unnamed protein product [Cylindrotheca closterium]|uniref:DUF2423 domain-containing protein n=1 Tax=Cylindrotheca closterium TaxID=2856 RepID=A0AAD2JJ48_9STRA|nr:unnamed protein product [Cylindrotheca closterium]
MAKSIRAKCKRKNRSEFRRTLGEAAYQKQQAKVQEKMKDCIEKNSMQSYERLSNLLQPNADEEVQVMETNLGIDAEPATVDLKGENKAPVKTRGKRRKHTLRTKKRSVDKEQKPAEKRRPKFFVQF